MSNQSTPTRMGSTFKPSPFRRPGSPLGRSTSTVRASTPQGSPLKQSTHFEVQISERNMSNSPVPFNLPMNTSTKSTVSPNIHTNSQNAYTSPARKESTRTTDALSSIPPNYLHTMRESFSVLDRSNTGQITKSDVSSTLSELGLDNSASAIADFFPNGGALNLSTYLNTLAQDLTQLSRQEELSAAFSAFDKDDSGQIDINELKDTLLHTLPENGRNMNEREIDQVLEGFVGRRILRKGQVGSGLGGNKEVFRYDDFITNIWASGTSTGSL